MLSIIFTNIISLAILVGIIILIGKLLRSESKTQRILGKIIIGLLLAPFVILILLFLGCWVILGLGSLF